MVWVRNNNQDYQDDQKLVKLSTLSGFLFVIKKIIEKSTQCECDETHICDIKDLQDDKSFQSMLKTVIKHLKQKSSRAKNNE